MKTTTPLVLLVILCLACAGVKPTVRPVESTSPIAGEWENTAEGQRAVYSFAADGTLSMRQDDGPRAQGRYKFLDKERVGLEYISGVFMQGVTYRVSFPDQNRMLTTSETSGRTYEWRRVK